MTIIDAIERAKRLGLTPAGLAGRGRPQPQEQVVTPARDTPARDAHAPAAPRVLMDYEPFTILRLPDQPSGDSMIVALTGDSQVQRSGSPPYRMLRARVLQRCREAGWSTLALTSPGPGEGKTVTSLNLAFSVAREGNYDVFLLDLDLRNPSVCKYLAVSPPVEIADYFSGRATEHDAFFTLAGIERLSIAGGTRSNSYASELLASGRLDELLRYIQSIAANPLIIVDLPPVVNTDDALVVAPRMDALLLVVTEGVTRRDNLQRALSLLSGFSTAGVLLNRSHESLGSQYYGS